MENLNILREEAHDYINRADDRLLRLAHALLAAGIETKDLYFSNESMDLMEHGEEKYISSQKRSLETFLDERLGDHQKNPHMGEEVEAVVERIRKQPENNR